MSIFDFLGLNLIPLLENQFGYAWDFLILYLILIVFYSLRSWKSNGRWYRFAYLGIIALLFCYGLFVAAYVFTLIGIMGILKYSEPRRNNKFVHVLLLLPTPWVAIVCLSATISVIFGDRWYVMRSKSPQFVIGYYPAKLIGTVGDGDTGKCFFYYIGLNGIQKRIECVTRSSVMPFSKYSELAKADDEILCREAPEYY